MTQIVAPDDLVGAEDPATAAWDMDGIEKGPDPVGSVLG